jgi:leucyl aminopeptidase
MKDCTLEKARIAGGNAYLKIKSSQSHSVTIAVDVLAQAASLTPGAQVDLTLAFLEGFLLGHYRFDQYKSKPPNALKELSRVFVTCAQKHFLKVVGDQLPLLVETVKAVNITRDWSNEPSNIGTPEYYANEAKKLARDNHLKFKVLGEKECKKENMNLFLAVGQGSHREGKVVVVEYLPKKKTKGSKKIALVGKGITFDSGGISIKPALKMEEMKHDMTGAATVMGALVLASKMNLPHHIIGVMAFTENMPSGHAIHPGNVVAARNGTTVEIINTDAEGRLILADALDYAQDFKPEIMINLATLTGAASICFGKYCSGVMGNSETLIDALKKASDESGERLWPLPLWDDYLEDVRSDVADLKNVGAAGQAGTIAGGIFLKQFVRKGVSWAHLDIANIANGLTHLSYVPKKGASGLMVRTLARYLSQVS